MRVYVDTNVLMILHKIGYFEFLKFSKKCNFIVSIVAIRQIHHICNRARRLLWLLVDRGVLKLENSSYYGSFDKYILAKKNENIELLSLDKLLLSRYYRGALRKVYLSKNKLFSII